VKLADFGVAQRLSSAKPDACTEEDGACRGYTLLDGPRGNVLNLVGLPFILTLY